MGGVCARRKRSKIIVCQLGFQSGNQRWAINWVGGGWVDCWLVGEQLSESLTFSRGTMASPFHTLPYCGPPYFHTTVPQQIPANQTRSCFTIEWVAGVRVTQRHRDRAKSSQTLLLERINFLLTPSVASQNSLWSTLNFCLSYTWGKSRDFLSVDNWYHHHYDTKSFKKLHSRASIFTFNSSLWWIDDGWVVGVSVVVCGCVGGWFCPIESQRAQSSKPTPEFLTS